MTAKLSAIVSEFDTEEQADSYDRWFRAKVQAAMDDTRPSIPHDQAMAPITAAIQAAKKKVDRCRDGPIATQAARIEGSPGALTMP